MSESSAIPVTETRFRFGRNWRHFLSVLNDTRIRSAEASLRELLGVSSLEGRTFLDIGSGSGLFSLAAMRLGAARVSSFDYDNDSVECARELRRRYFANREQWMIQQGSVLDEPFVRSLGQWDVVYSWGVLHHTGHMYDAFANVIPAVRENGQLVIAIYNDQGLKSRLWWSIKRAYNRSLVARAAIIAAYIPYSLVGAFALDVLRGRNPIIRYTNQPRGMSFLYDCLDWLGGFPFEVASREVITSYFESRGFKLEKLISCGNKLGCNQFTFRKTSP